MGIVGVEAPPAPPGTRRTDSIKTDNAARQDVGDLTGLKQSIQELGILQPIGVTPSNTLIFGARRLAAAKEIGLKVVPVTVIQDRVDATNLLQAEYEENTCRKEMTPSELVALGLKLEELERPRARKRRREGGGRGGSSRSADSGINPLRPGRVYTKEYLTSTDYIIGTSLGLSSATYKRYKQVAKAISDPDQDVADAAKEQMKLLDAGRATAGAAWSVVKKVQDTPKELRGIPPEERPPPQHIGHGHEKRQIRAMEQTMPLLRGMVDGLDGMFSEGIEKTFIPVVGAYARELRTEARRLSAIARRLTEVTHLHGEI